MDTSAGTNPTSQWDAADYTAHGRFVPNLAGAVLDLLATQPGEHILDVGCGDGLLTAQILEAGARVVGIDSSPALVARAQSRGLDVVLGDAASMTYQEEFDAVFSNAALHWMLDYQRVANRMWAALKPAGRLVVEFGGFGNIAAIRTALRAVLTAHGYRDVPSDQFYPQPAQYEAVLAAAGFADISAQLVHRPTPLPGGMRAWLRTFRTGLLNAAGVPDAVHDEVFTEVCDLLKPALRDHEGNWWADYVRLRVTARR